MANWFKIYETDLDEKRLKYALDKLPEVGWVWIGILSECCKHRSDTIRYSQSEIDLFGFSDALKVSIPKINEAFRLLAEIEYIEILEGHIRVIRWESKQSEYNHRKSKGHYRRVSDNIREYPLEERRGEESIIENTGTVAPLPPTPKKPKAAFSKPTPAELELEAGKIGLSQAEADKFFNYYESNGWKVGRNPMKSWRHALINWKNNAHNYSATKPNPRNEGCYKSGTDFEAVTEQLRMV